MKVLLVGVGRYGLRYLDYIIENPGADIELVGIVEKYYEFCQAKEKIENIGIPVFKSLDEFYKNNFADLAIIITPPFLHSEQSVFCMSKGSNVLCEKPIASTIEDAQKMIEAEEKYNKFIAIGYQWSFSNAILNLKKDILNERFGNPVVFKSLSSFPRGKKYYANSWGGKLTFENIPVYDCIASNACAHDVHNMFFLLGESLESSASANKVEAQLFRANKIETFDTCIVKMETENNVRLYFSASHATNGHSGPRFEFVFENGHVEFNADNGLGIVGYLKNGEKINYGDPYADGVAKKLNDCIYAIKNGITPVCTSKTAISHTKFIKDLFENNEIMEFPENMVIETEENFYVKGLYDILLNAYEDEKMIKLVQVKK